MGAAQRGHPGREGQGRLRAARRRDPRGLVAAGDQRRGLEVLPRRAREPGARAQRQADDRARGAHDPRLGQRAGLLRHRGGRRDLRGRADPSAGAAEGVLQQPGVVQRRHRAPSAVLRLLHPVGARHDGVDPRLVPERGDHLQGRLRVGRQPVAHPLVEGEAGGRRHRFRAGVVHEGRRRLRRGDQVGRQDPPGGEDGRARRRSPGHRRVHPLQGGGGEEGLGADRRRLRLLARRAGLRLGVLPEREQLGPRDRLLHAGGGGGRRVADAQRDRRQRRSDPASARPVSS